MVAIDIQQKIWLDDIRPCPYPDANGEMWFHAKTADEAIALLKHRVITEISFDHDLGHTVLYRERTGYDVACYIEEQAHEGKLPRMKWKIHSANPSGALRIRNAMRQAEIYWARNESKNGENRDL